MPNNLAQTIRNSRKAKGITRVELARQSGLSTSSLYLIENGKMEQPKREMLQKLSKTLNLDFKELLQIAGYEEQSDFQADLQTDLGSIIRKKRLEKGLSVREFSRLCGVTEQQISNIETGKSKQIKVKTLKKFAKVLSFKPEELNVILWYEENGNGENKLWELIEQVCIEKMLTDIEKEEEFGLSMGALNRIRKGKTSNMHINTLEVLADYFGLDVEDVKKLAKLKR